MRRQWRKRTPRDDDDHDGDHDDDDHDDDHDAMMLIRSQKPI